ncbi:hypothetical protein U9M48_003460 [Paspalum notatum var. saurae]|uniref:Uncharacterized protein n=1 Tax=Paspalum notatum var. saurae TaxID=547442 RepID=A0AAQ3PSZ0_PASNO
MAASTLRLGDGSDHEEIVNAEDLCLEPPATGFADEEWTLQIECKGASRQRDIAELMIDKAYITFVNLCVLKDKLGYSVRDFMYYKRRCATGVASLQEIDYEHQAREMVRDNESERKVRLIMAKESLKDLSVSITPIKRTREQQQEDLPCVQEGLDAYKVMILTMMSVLQRKMKEMKVAKQGKIGLLMHAVLKKQEMRIKSGCQKLPIEFSSRLGGPVGVNYHSFVDEVVMFTRKRAPLIGVQSWKDVHESVQEAIVTDMKNRWDFGNIPEAQVDKKILGIARSRYAGWRSTLSATYKAYESDVERAKHKPADVDSVEWHYLMKYFATEKFQTVSKKNSACRGNQQVQHGGGPKPFSQHSYEKRNPETGEEPNDIELWMITHSKNGKWSNPSSQDVYENAVLNLNAKQTELKRDRLTDVEQNILFQSSYR